MEFLLCTTVGYRRCAGMDGDDGERRAWVPAFSLLLFEGLNWVNTVSWCDWDMVIFLIVLEA